MSLLDTLTAAHAAGDTLTRDGLLRPLFVTAGSAELAKSLVVHCKRAPHDIYIGRPSKWGNPFVVGRDGSREEVIERYLVWLLQQPHLLVSLKELAGKVLGCWCAPLACHGYPLAQLANSICQ